MSETQARREDSGHLRRRLLLLCMLSVGILALCWGPSGEKATDDAISELTDTPIHDIQHRPGQLEAQIAAEVSRVRPTSKAFEQKEALVRGSIMPVASGHVMARLKGEEASVGRRLAALGSRVLSRSPFTGKVRVAVPEGEDPEGFAARLKQKGLASESHPDPLCEGAGLVPEAPLLDLQWHHEAINVMPLWQAQGLDCYAGRAVVAVLDTGIAYEDHTDSSGSYNLSPDLGCVAFREGFDFINDDEHPNDDHSHGTHIATVIAGLGATQGVAYGVDLMPIKVLDHQKTGTESALVDGIYYALTNGAHVINMSLSFPLAYLPGKDLESAITAAEEEGITMVAASGNGGEDRVSYPAAFRAVIAVGAASLKSSNEFSRADYSNYGPALDLLAPGGDVTMDKNKDDYPDGILSETTSQGQPGDFGYWFISGTSAAAAQVSAVAAIIRETGLSGEAVRDVLVSSARALPKHNKTGEFSVESGSGLLDAWAAYQAAESWSDESRPRYAINSALILTDKNGNPDERSATAFIEVIEIHRGQVTPAAGVKVHAAWLGDVAGHGDCTTDSAGQCQLNAGTRANAMVFGVALHGVEDTDHHIHRPVGFTQMDLLSYRLVSSMARGLGAQEVAFLYADSALAELALQVDDDIVSTVTIKNIGTGLASSAIVLGVEVSHFLSSSVAPDYALLTSFGTGLASSAIVWDQDLFNPNLLSDTSEALIFGHTSGSGLASSAIVLGEDFYGLDDFLGTLDPGVVYFNNGTGLASSAIVLDQTLWNPELFSALPGFGDDLYGVGTGLASSAFVFDFSPGAIDWLGFDPEDFGMGGAGLGASSFVFDAMTDLYASTTMELTTFMPLGMDLDSSAQSLGEVEFQP